MNRHSMSELSWNRYPEQLLSSQHAFDSPAGWSCPRSSPLTELGKVLHTMSGAVRHLVVCQYACVPHRIPGTMPLPSGKPMFTTLCPLLKSSRTTIGENRKCQDVRHKLTRISSIHNFTFSATCSLWSVSFTVSDPRPSDCRPGSDTHLCRKHEECCLRQAQPSSSPSCALAHLSEHAQVSA